MATTQNDIDFEDDDKVYSIAEATLSADIPTLSDIERNTLIKVLYSSTIVIYDDYNKGDRFFVPKPKARINEVYNVFYEVEIAKELNIYYLKLKSKRNEFVKLNIATN